MFNFYHPDFNPEYAAAGITLPGIVTFKCYVGPISRMCHKCETHVW